MIAYVLVVTVIVIAPAAARLHPGFLVTMSCTLKLCVTPEVAVMSRKGKSGGNVRTPSVPYACLVET